jgi:hypothetical protein
MEDNSLSSYADSPVVVVEPAIFLFNKGRKWNIGLLKILDHFDVPDQPYSYVLKGAQDTYQDGYTFDVLPDGLSQHVVAHHSLHSIDSGRELLPSVNQAPIPDDSNTAMVDVTVFDFVPQFMSLIQNIDLMAKDNLLFDWNNSFQLNQRPSNI